MDEAVVIPLTLGFYTTVDRADLPLLEGSKWRASQAGPNKWYAAATRCGRTVYLHRLLMGSPKGLLVDHRDNDGLNNRRSNLRIATKSQNAANSDPRPHSSSGVKGVRWDADRKKWAANITVGKKTKGLGRFATKEEAEAAYQIEAQKAFGEFARGSF